MLPSTNKSQNYNTVSSSNGYPVFLLSVVQTLSWDENPWILPSWLQVRFSRCKVFFSPWVGFILINITFTCLFVFIIFHLQTRKENNSKENKNKSINTKYIYTKKYSHFRQKRKNI